MNQITHFTFNDKNFNRFSTSTGTDGNYVGIYNEKILRVIEKRIDDFKELLRHIQDLPFLIHSKIILDESHRLIIEHHRLENFTYYDEWTKRQRVEAALAIIQLQDKLSTIGFFLTDPHAFNITFKFSDPIYFDLGSVTKGTIKPWWWFLKCFTGYKEHDYWDEVLGISSIRKFVTAFFLSFHRRPYSYLQKVIKRYENKWFENFTKLLITKNNFISKVIRKLNKFVPGIFRNVTNWTDYDQKDPSLNVNIERTANIISIFKQYLPKTVLDIGANRGAYTFLALEYGTSEAISLDLDSFSIDLLREKAGQTKAKIITATLNIMDYDETPGCYDSYLAAHRRLNCEFGLCLAVVHHVCYFGNNSFDEFAERLSRFVSKILVVEFVPYDDVHLTGPAYKGKDRSWYTTDNFIQTVQKYFPGDYEIFNSTPRPRILIKFTK
jgi:SAM-dependent methyltransferase